MKIKIFGALLVATFAITSLARAQTRTPVINDRERRQEHRIDHGVRKGELTKHEARHLRKDERNIRTDKRMAKSDGRVTAGERRHLRREENRASRAIYRKKHNDRVS